MARRDFFAFYAEHSWISSLATPTESLMHCCLPYKHPKLQWLITTVDSHFGRNKHLSVAQLGTSSSVSPRRMQSSCQPGLWSHLKTLMGWSTCSQVHTYGHWPTLVLTLGTCRRATHSMAACFLRSKLTQLREDKKEPSRWKLQSFNNLVSEMISYYFFHILLISYESVNPVQTQAEGFCKGIEYQQVVSLRPILQAAYHIHPNIMDLIW